MCVFRSVTYLCRVSRTTRRPRMHCCCGVSGWSTDTRTSVCATSPRRGETEKHSSQSYIDTGHCHQLLVVLVAVGENIGWAVKLHPNRAPNFLSGVTAGCPVLCFGCKLDGGFGVFFRKEGSFVPTKYLRKLSSDDAAAYMY